MKISQREARRLRKRLTEIENELECQRRAWSQEYIGGVQIGRASMPDDVAASIRTARKLGHAVVVVGDDSTTIRFQALPHPKV